ncbi:hypothetical protein [Facklamia sp. P12955]|uniref:hypothetical protein n=1 Tax=Facklamia sp. P12955 TaxID=3421946 RepID=UPI003D179C91
MKIVYSGDLRLNGYNPEKVLKWVEEAHTFEPDLLLIEGTSLSNFGDDLAPHLAVEGKNHNLACSNERQFLKESDHLLGKKQAGIITINLYPQNIQCLIRLNEIAKNHQRRFVVDKAYYQLLKQHISSKIDNIFCLGEDEEESSLSVSAEELKASPNDYLFLIDYERHQILYQLPAGIYLHSNGVPLGVFMAGYEEFLTNMVEYGRDFYQAGVSGHASQADLLMIGYTIQSKVVIPWHTFKPKAFGQELETKGLIVFYPQYGQIYTMDKILEGNNA